MKEDEMVKVGGWITAALESLDNESRLGEISKEVAAFAREFPLFAY
jgi:glycine hydroxymethyltransferase